MNAMCMGVTLGGQKVTSDPLELDFQVVDTCFTCVLGTAQNPLQDQQRFLTTRSSL